MCVCVCVCARASVRTRVCCGRAWNGVGRMRVSARTFRPALTTQLLWLLFLGSLIGLSSQGNGRRPPSAWRRKQQSRTSGVQRDAGWAAAIAKIAPASPAADVPVVKKSDASFQEVQSSQLLRNQALLSGRRSSSSSNGAGRIGRGIFGGGIKIPWWLKSPQWWMEPPHEWGSAPPSMYAPFYHPDRLPPPPNTKPRILPLQGVDAPLPEVSSSSES